MKYKSLILVAVLCFSLSGFAQLQPVVNYEGDLYFVPAKLTKNGTAFLYSFHDHYEADNLKTWFTVFDSDLDVVARAEINTNLLEYKIRKVKSQRSFFSTQGYLGGGETRAKVKTSSYDADGYFLDEWTVVEDDTTTEKCYIGYIEHPTIYEDNNNHATNNLYLSQTLFDDDEDFEFLRGHYDVMPLSYNQADNNSGGQIMPERNILNGEYFDEVVTHYTDYERKGYVTVIARYEYYGGVKCTGTDICKLDGTVERTIEGLTNFSSAIEFNGNYYVSAYDWNTQKYGLYKIATAAPSGIQKIAELTDKTGNNITYNLSGIRVNPNTKGIVIQNGVKRLNK